VPTRQETVRQAVSIFAEAEGQYGGEPDRAWLGIYTALLWYEETGREDRPRLPHIIDADKLRKPRAGKLGIWQRRAGAVGEYLAREMGCGDHEVDGRVDQLLRGPGFQGLQRQNPLGIAFIGLVHHVMGRHGRPTLTYDMEIRAQDVFPGITFPGRSTSPSIDVLARREGRAVAIISVKWSVRHDRVNDLTNECPAYKGAASWGRNPLRYIVVTNEFDPARLHKMLGDSCIDAVVHVHKKAVVDVAGLDGRLEDMWDLRELFALDFD